MNLTDFSNKNSSISSNNPLKPLENLDIDTVRNEPHLLDLISKFMEQTEMENNSKKFDTKYI